ncbi:MAG: hypothetical protein FJW21_01585 [Acidimicrobiia bacterium]|nr:hypothetical protein [Acidimicrobiia bacterium]
MNTTHSFPDALIVLALVGALVAWWYFRSRERERRMQIIHQERLIAMEKGFPLPELPLEPVKAPEDPRELLIHGVAWVAMGLGGMLAMGLTGMNFDGTPLWPLPMPLLLFGVGLMWGNSLGNRRSR